MWVMRRHRVRTSSMVVRCQESSGARGLFATDGVNDLLSPIRTTRRSVTQRFDRHLSNVESSRQNDQSPIFFGTCDVLHRVLRLLQDRNDVDGDNVFTRIRYRLLANKVRGLDSFASVTCSVTCRQAPCDVIVNRLGFLHVTNKTNGWRWHLMNFLYQSRMWLPSLHAFDDSRISWAAFCMRRTSNSCTAKVIAERKKQRNEKH